jgi:hypothetical protein
MRTILDEYQENVERDIKYMKLDINELEADASKYIKINFFLLYI